jgi:Ca2+-binding RTX toxin-like protein
MCSAARKATRLSDRGGANTLNGDDGGDQLYGLGGRDVLTGGADADTFYYLALSDSGTKASTRDVITDFIPGSFDIIDLSAIDANGNAAGDPLFNFIGLTPFSGARGELRESFSKGETIISGDVNGDGKADFSIALTGFVLLSGADFHL